MIVFLISGKKTHKKKTFKMKNWQSARQINYARENKKNRNKGVKLHLDNPNVFNL